MSVRDKMTPKYTKEETIKKLEEYKLDPGMIDLIRSNNEVYEAVRDGYNVPDSIAPLITKMLNKIWESLKKSKSEI